MPLAVLSLWLRTCSLCPALIRQVRGVLCVQGYAAHSWVQPVVPSVNAVVPGW